MAGKPPRKKKDEAVEADSDDHFAFIAGYTSGGVAYGITDEEMEEIEASPAASRLNKAPPAQKGTISLGELIQQMQMVSDSMVMYYQRSTGMYFPVSDEYAYLAEEEAEIGERPEWEQEAIRSTADILACENGDYVELPSRYEIDEYSIMDSYCNTVKNRRIADDLCRSICGKGAFRRFKDAVRRHGIEQDWYRYRDESYKEIAKDWCEENGIAYRD